MHANPRQFSIEHAEEATSAETSAANVFDYDFNEIGGTFYKSVTMSENLQIVVDTKTTSLDTSRLLRFIKAGLKALFNCTFIQIGDDRLPQERCPERRH